MISIKLPSKRTIKLLRRLTAGLAVFGLVLASAPVSPVHAAVATSIQDTLSRVKASTLANHEIEFVTPTGVGQTTDTIILTFETFTMGTFALANVDFAVSADGTCTTFGTEKTLAATAAAATWGVAQAGQAITLTPPTDAGASEIVASRCVQIEIGSNATAGGAGATQITNPAVGNYDIDITGSFGDTGAASVSVITDDIVNVTATVDEYITFTISDATIGFGALSTTVATWANGATTGSATDVAAHTMTLATNARSGYAITYNGATLTSGADTITVASVTNDADGVPGTEQFGKGFSTDGNATIAAAYDHNVTAASRDWAFVASTTTTVVSETVPTATETISAFYLANIAATTEAGSYSTNITYIATGTF